MREPQTAQAIAAATATAASVGLAADEAVVLQNANRLTVRLLPADLVARVAPTGHDVARFEVELAQRLVGAGCPVAALDPRVPPAVHRQDGFSVTLWTHYERVGGDIPPADYAAALGRLHAGMRSFPDVAVPHFTDRSGEALRLVTCRALSPALAEADRWLLAEALRDLTAKIDRRGASEQLLHGEPHPGNVLRTEHGPLFIDLETCCRGPVEFDLAHAPEEVGPRYPGADVELLRDCRLLMLAMITAWRWDRNDRFPDGHRLGLEWLDQLRAALG